MQIFCNRRKEQINKQKKHEWKKKKINEKNRPKENLQNDYQNGMNKEKESLHLFFFQLGEN